MMLKKISLLVAGLAFATVMVLNFYQPLNSDEAAFVNLELLQKGHAQSEDPNELVLCYSGGVLQMVARWQCDDWESYGEEPENNGCITGWEYHPPFTNSQMYTPIIGIQIDCLPGDVWCSPMPCS